MQLSSSIVAIMLSISAIHVAAQAVVHDYIWIQYNALGGEVFVVSTTDEIRIIPTESEGGKGMTSRTMSRMAKALFAAVQEYEAKGWELFTSDGGVMVMRRRKE